jgi:hypothetical protein
MARHPYAGRSLGDRLLYWTRSHPARSCGVTFADILDDLEFWMTWSSPSQRPSPTGSCTVCRQSRSASGRCRVAYWSISTTPVRGRANTSRPRRSAAGGPRRRDRDHSPTGHRGRAASRRRGWFHRSVTRRTHTELARATSREGNGKALRGLYRSIRATRAPANATIVATLIPGGCRSGSSSRTNHRRPRKTSTPPNRAVTALAGIQVWAAALSQLR